jgi:hypothetical protein
MNITAHFVRPVLTPTVRPRRNIQLALFSIIIGSAGAVYNDGSKVVNARWSLFHLMGGFAYQIDGDDPPSHDVVVLADC